MIPPASALTTPAVAGMDLVRMHLLTGGGSDYIEL